MPTKKQNNSNFSFYFIEMIKSEIIGVIVSIILMLFTAFLINNLFKHEKFYSLIAVIFQCMPSFLSGKIIGKKVSHSLFFLGLIQGALILALFVAISFIIQGTNLNLRDVLVSSPYIMLSSVVGSITSQKRRKIHKHS